MFRSILKLKHTIITEMPIKNQPLIQIDSNPHWQTILAQAYRDPHVLIKELALDTTCFSIPANQQFKLLAPQPYVAKIKKGDWNDPLLRQILPVTEEMHIKQGFGIDPVGDAAAMVSDGVLHKYNGRVLLVTTGACAIHCRYCFRRHFPYSDANPAKDNWQNALSYIASNSRIKEVILSGGDPLVLSDEKLHSLCSQIADIPHVKRLRIHSRLPVVLPERIDRTFLKWFEKLPLQKILVIHANHAQELGDDVLKILSHLSSINTLLLNQSVLLRNVNDSLEALSNLSERLVENNVQPYYLHLLDRVQGASHFEVSRKEAIQLMQELRDQLSGYMVPKLVQEIAGKAAKQPVE